MSLIQKICFVFTDIFTKDIEGDAEKVVKKSFSTELTSKNEFDIDLDAIPPWKIFSELQMQLHTTSLEPQYLKFEAVNDLIDKLFDCINKHVLPDPMYRTIATLMVHLFLLIGKFYTTILLTFNLAKV